VFPAVPAVPISRSRRPGSGRRKFQEIWLRYAASTTAPASPKAFLSAVVTRVSIDVLRSARLRREASSGFRDRDGKIVNTWALDIQDGQIQTIRTVLNPDKLAHVGPVADAWAVLHEAYLARRPTD